MSNRSICIGITAYNAADSIAAAINSALSQDTEVAEIIIVDDCSSDETVAVIQTFHEQHEKIRLICHDRNQGVAAARNTIINATTADFLAFFDDDDISLPDRVRRQRDHIIEYELAHAKGAPVVCHTARTQIYPDGTERIEPAMGSNAGEAPNGQEVLRFTLMGAKLRDGAFGACATCSQMARLSTYRELGGFDAFFRRCEDSDLALRLAKTGGHFTGIGAPLVTQWMTGTSEKALDTLVRYSTALLEKHQDAFESVSEYQFSSRWLSLKYKWLSGHRWAFLFGIAQLALTNPVRTSGRLLAAYPNRKANNVFGRFARSHRSRVR